MQDYHRLVAWQKAHDLTINIQRATRSFRRAWCIGLRTQIVRAAEAIPTNIVEGCFAASLQSKSAGCSSGCEKRCSRHRRQSRWYFLLATE